MQEWINGVDKNFFVQFIHILIFIIIISVLFVCFCFVILVFCIVLNMSEGALSH